MHLNLAIGKNLDALKRVVAMLVAMVGLTAGNQGPGTLPRHLHRLALSLLHPAESAARRPIILAARGLVVEINPSRPKPAAWLKDGIVRLWSQAISRAADPHRPMSLSLLDPLRSSGIRESYETPTASPPEWSPGAADSIMPHFRRAAPARPAPDDPLDAGRLHRRLKALASALDDLPRLANRMARWQARRDASRTEELEVANSGFGPPACPTSRSKEPGAQLGQNLDTELSCHPPKNWRAQRVGKRRTEAGDSRLRSLLRPKRLLQWSGHLGREVGVASGGTCRHVIYARDGP